MSKVIRRMDIMAGSSSEIIPDDIMSRFGKEKHGFQELSCVSGIDEDALYPYFAERCQNSPYAIEVVYRAVHREFMATGELPGHLAWKELTKGKRE